MVESEVSQSPDNNELNFKFPSSPNIFGGILSEGFTFLNRDVSDFQNQASGSGRTVEPTKRRTEQVEGDLIEHLIFQEFSAPRIFGLGARFHFGGLSVFVATFDKRQPSEDH